MIVAQNRKANFDYEILETFEAGLSLLGTEIKSLRAGGCSLTEAYVMPLRGEIWLLGAHIPKYTFGNIHNHEEKRDRKLLLHKWEMDTLARKIKEKGLTIVPLTIHLVKGRAKLKIALARGKKTIDKRETIKKRDIDRKLQQAKRS